MDYCRFRNCVKTDSIFERIVRSKTDLARLSFPIDYFVNQTKEVQISNSPAERGVEWRMAEEKKLTPLSGALSNQRHVIKSSLPGQAFVQKHRFAARDLQPAKAYRCCKLHIIKGGISGCCDYELTLKQMSVLYSS